MKKYWPLLLIIGSLTAIICMSQYADASKDRYEQGAKHVKEAPVTTDNNENGGNNTKDTYQPPVWAKFVTWPEGVGAWAIILTLLAISWQSVETRQAAIAAKDSIRFQELAMQQWVQLVNWKVDKIGIRLLRLTVELQNPTEFPMTIEEGAISAVAPDGDTAPSVHTIGYRVFLPPKIPYEIQFPVVLSLQQGVEFENNGLSLSIRGNFSHRARFGTKDEVRQPFSGVLRCGDRQDPVMNWVAHMNPETKEQRDKREEIERLIKDGFDIDKFAAGIPQNSPWPWERGN